MNIKWPVTRGAFYRLSTSAVSFGRVATVPSSTPVAAWPDNLREVTSFPPIFAFEFIVSYQFYLSAPEREEYEFCKLSFKSRMTNYLISHFDQ